MKNLSKLALVTLASTFAVSANADPITINPITGGDDGGNVGGYAMTDWDQQVTTDPTNSADDVDCVTSAGVDGDMCFYGRYDTESDIDIINNPWWWQYEHGNVYVTNKNWIEIVLPQDTMALSLWVGASFSGHAWIESVSSDGFTTARTEFYVNPQNTAGYGIYSDGCTNITRVIVEPADWGFGNLSINQGEFNSSCSQVPEPAPLWLLGMGLLGMALARHSKSLT